MLVSNQEFILKEIPKFIPESSKHIEFWRGEKRKCIEGLWVSGKWMPGPLYFFVNFWHIKLKKSKHSKTETTERPFLRDLEWEKAYLLMEAKGFSGFELDDKYTCDRLYEYSVRKENETLGLIPINNKIYTPAREYLKKHHDKNYGKPLYENNCRNVMDLESRGGGKSYWAAGAMIAQNFLFDGATDYDEYLKGKQTGKLLSSETLVGSIDSKYSTNLLDKFKLGFGELPGKQEYNGKLFQSPLYVENKGSLECNKFIQAVRETKIGGNWIEQGSRSKIHHRSFSDNPLAGNGTRPNATLIEEVGFHNNLVDSLGALKDCTMNGASKFGYIWMFGTGGDNEGQGSAQMREVFYAPEEFDCLVFEDEWENKGKICYFVQVTRTLNEFKDTEGNTVIHLAEKQVDKDRAKVKNNAQNYLHEITNRPLKPSEAFMSADHNIFPVKDLGERLAELETTKSIMDGIWTGWLKINTETGITEYKISDDKPITEFPLKSKNKNALGCIQIYEHPYTEKPDRGMYYSGLDTYDDDDSSTTSLGSIFIVHALTRRIVAEYTGRPKTAADFYEISRRLLMYYNAECCYENNKKGFGAYMENKNCLHFLAKTPNSLKDVENVTIYETGNKAYGVHASDEVNKYARRLLRAWCLEDAYNEPENVTNSHKIRSMGLLKELINYYPKGNFDRISAMGMLCILLEDRKKQTDAQVNAPIESVKDDFFFRNYKGKSKNWGDKYIKQN